MELILVAGVLAYIESVVPGAAGSSMLRLTAERIAAGDATALGKLVPHMSPADAAALTHAALTQGFGWVMLYGGIGVWTLAAASAFVFGRQANRGQTDR